jgi:hypothetical protein
MPPPMSLERRRLVLAATLILKSLGHSGFDRLLLELGVPEDVGTGSGLLARANSLGRYVLSNPDAKAFDGTLLSDALLRRAKGLYEGGAFANIPESEREEFEAALAANLGDRIPADHGAEQSPAKDDAEQVIPLLEPP